jgi:hypothetical protein
MTRYRALCALNCAQGADLGRAMSLGYTPNQPLAADPRTEVAIEADTDMDALNAVWAVGNRMSTDVDGKSWSSNVRSLSVGDVVVLTPSQPGTPTAWKVDPIGFSQIDHEIQVATGHHGTSVLVKAGAASI